MIEAGLSLVRFFLGLAALLLVGYGGLALITPALRDFSWGERLSFSFGIGALLLTLWMLTLSSLGRPFSLPLILGPLMVLPGAALLVNMLGGEGLRDRAKRRKGEKAKRDGVDKDLFPLRNSLTWLFWGLLGILFLFATLRATLYPMWAWDSIATWGLKAKAFYLHRSIDFTGITAHNYYPNLVPLLLSYLYLCLGQVNDHLVQGVFPFWGALLLMLLYSFLLRLGLNRRQALGLTSFFALNGTVFIVHLYIAYADLALTFYTLGAVGLLFLWLKDAAPRGSLPLMAIFLAALPWCKYEGTPLAATIILAGGLTLAWLRPPEVWRRLLNLAWPLGGLILGYLPWRLYCAAHYLEGGSDHILGFYPHHLLEAIPWLLAALINPQHFGILWPVLLVSFIISGKTLRTSPRLFPALFIAGNLAAILLAYAVAPTSAAEFPQYVRGTVDRLLLHVTPTVALLVGLGWKDLGEGP
jgi:hypothetical protein